MKEKAASSFVTAYGRYIIFLVLFILVGYVLLSLTYENVKLEMIDNLNARQMIHAKQAAKAIEFFFDDHITMLQNLAVNQHIIDLDEDGKRTMREFHSLKSAEVSIITRIDNQGRIVHSEPYNSRVIGQTVTKMEDFEEVKRTHQIVVSDVFTNRRGFKTIIAHVPVFKRDEFNGTIALLFPFDLIAKRHIEDIRIGKDGYAWIISKDGTELSCPVPGHVGNSVFDNCREFPDILAMAKRMIRGEQGVTTYQFDRIRKNVTSKITKHAVFMPIRLKNNFWSIVVATPQDEVLGALKGFRDRLLLIATFLAIGIGFFLYILIKTRIVVKEVERRLKIEEALQESEKRLEKINECFLRFGTDTNENINRLTALCGELLRATCALYNRLDGDMLCSWGQWNTPVDYNPVDTPEGHICYDVIKSAGDETLVITNLPDTHYAQTDPNVIPYKLQTYVGRVVKLRDDYVGSLCVVYQDDIIPGEADKRAIEIIASAIGVEEERKLAEEALRESDARYKDLASFLPLSLFETDDQGNVTYANHFAFESIGYTQEDIDKGFNMLQVIHPKDHDRAIKMSMQVMQGEHTGGSEYLVQRKDGSTFPAFINTRASIKDDKPVGLKGYIFNLTEQKMAEEALRESEEKLRQAQKMESIGTLAGGIAHDFNNVLYAIIGYTELTMDDVPEGNPAQKNLKEVFKGAMRAKDMVQQILAFSRKADTQKKPIKVQSVVKEAIKLLRTSIPSTIEIRHNIDKDCSPVMADSTQIHQVVMNLATNAYQAMREKGGVLELTLMGAEISSDDSDPDLGPGTYLKLTVSDTGHGMDNVVIEKIFDPYFSTKGPGEGTGMGLAVVHGIVKDHGGNIEVYSKLGEGSTFSVYLPLVETRPFEPETVSVVPVLTGTERILFVDDEEALVFMTQQTLERLGYQVTSRTSSVEALEAFRAKPDAFDLVITDMTMPNITGVELTSRLKEIRADIPIIICTGFSEVIDKNRAKALGIREYVMKPIVKEEIARTIRKVLDEGKEK